MMDDMMMISRIQIAVGSYLLLPSFNFRFLVLRNQVIKNFNV